MDDSLHHFVIDQLQLCRGTWRSVAEQASVPYRTLQKIASGEIKDPGVTSVEKLAKYFREQQAA